MSRSWSGVWCRLGSTVLLCAAAAAITGCGSTNASATTVVPGASHPSTSSSVATTSSTASARRRYAYVVNHGSNTVSVINTTTNKVTATVRVGGDPEWVAVTPNGKGVYVANLGSDSVSVINSATNQVPATIKVGRTPNVVAVTPNGRSVYVTDIIANAVSVIDTATNHVTATIKVGRDPIGLAVSPNGQRVYVADNGPDRVSVIDTATNRVSAAIRVGKGPNGVTVAPNGRRVYVTSSIGVTVIDAATEHVVTTVPIGPDPWEIAVTPDSQHAYVAYGHNAVAVINTATNRVTATIKVGIAPIALAPSAENGASCQPRRQRRVRGQPRRSGHRERDQHRHQPRHRHHHDPERTGRSRLHPLTTTNPRSPAPTASNTLNPSQDAAVRDAILAQPRTLHTVAETDLEYDGITTGPRSIRTFGPNSNAPTKVAVAGQPGLSVMTYAYNGDSSWLGYSLTSGHWYHGPDPIDVNTEFAAKTGLTTGDSLTLTVNARAVRVRIAGEVFIPNGIPSVFAGWQTLGGTAAGLTTNQYDIGLTPGTNVQTYTHTLQRTRRRSDSTRHAFTAVLRRNQARATYRGGRRAGLGGWRRCWFTPCSSTTSTPRVAASAALRPRRRERQTGVWIARGRNGRVAVVGWRRSM